jgi:glycosyltransferase involved in cell wall biosynthesis
VKQYSPIYREVDHIIVLTNFSRDDIVKRCEISPKKTSVIPHGDFDYILSQYPCNECLADKVRQAAADRYVIAFLGLISPYKGLEYFIKAVPFIKSRRPDTFFLIAGSTRFSNQQQIEHLLEQNCNQNGVYIDFRYFPTSDLKAYLSVTDVLVQPYIRASQSGNTVMAYSLGIPVVCTDVGGLAEMVEDGRTGYVVPPKDPQAIADAVAKCLEGDNLAKMSDHAQQVAVEQYSWEKIAEQTADIYHHLAGVE